MDPRKKDGGPVVAGNFGRGDHLGNLIEGIGPMQEATDIRDLFAGLARSVVTALNADAALVSLVDQDDQDKDIIRDVATCVLPPYRLNTIVEEYPLAQYPMTRKVIESGESLEISLDDPDADPGELAFLHELGFSRMLMCSIVVDGRGIGIVEIYRRANRPFRTDDPRHVEVLTTFAANAYSKLQLAAKLEAQYTSTIEALVSALEARDPYTQAHTSRTRDLAGALADAVQVTNETRHAVRLGSARLGSAQLDPPRCREDRDLRRDPEEGRSAHRGRVGGDADASRDRQADARRHRLAEVCLAGDLPPPRTVGR